MLKSGEACIFERCFERGFGSQDRVLPVIICSINKLSGLPAMHHRDAPPGGQRQMAIGQRFTIQRQGTPCLPDSDRHLVHNPALNTAVKVLSLPRELSHFDRRQAFARNGEHRTHDCNFQRGR